MKPNDDFHCSSHPSHTDRRLIASSQPKGHDELRHQVCPYCVNSENSPSSANSSPSITPPPAATGGRDSHLSNFDLEPSAEPKDTAGSGYLRDAGNRPPSSLRATSGGQPSQRLAKTTTGSKMPFGRAEVKAASGSRPKNSSHLAATKSTTSLRNESDKSSYATSRSRTVTPAVGKLNSKNLTRSSTTKASSVTQFSESARIADSAPHHRTVSPASVAHRQTAPPMGGKTYSTRRPINFHIQQTGNNRQRPTGRCSEGPQPLTSDTVSRQQTSDRQNAQSPSTSRVPSASERAGNQSAMDNYVDIPVKSNDPTDAAQLPGTQLQRGGGFAQTDQPRFRQPYRTVESQRPSNKFTPLPSQSTVEPAFHGSSQESTAKSAFQRLEPNRSAAGNTEKSKSTNTETTAAPTMSDMETLATDGTRMPPTKIEFSKLQTGSPGLASSSRPLSNDEETVEILASTSKDEGAPYQTTTRRPMQRCLGSAQSMPTCALDEELRRSADDDLSHPQAEHAQKSTIQYSSRPALFALRQVQSAAAQPAPATSSAALPVVQPAPRSPGPTWNRGASPALSIDDVGADGNRAYIIRKERRGTIDWRRKPRYKVKQTATSRLRYSYWFADCGRQRVKAFRGDWSQIPPELLRDWEVYQNYFRYRVKGQRKRTSSLVRKFISGKYRQKRMPPAQKRPIRRMSPLLPGQSPSPRADGGQDGMGAGSGAVDLKAMRPGSNVRDLLMRQARAQLRRQEPKPQSQAGQPLDVHRKPQIQVRSTFTSRLRKSSTLQPCSKPVTPTLWHGSTGEMEDLKRKIANRRQRLKEHWLKQTSALMKLASRGGAQAQQPDNRMSQLMAHLMVVGAPPTDGLSAAPSRSGAQAQQPDSRMSQLMAHLMVVGAPSTAGLSAPPTAGLSAAPSQRANIAPEGMRAKSGAAKMPARGGAKRRNDSTGSSRVAQRFIRQQLPAIPETDWSTSSSRSDTSAGAVAPVSNFCQPTPSSMVHESLVPVAAAPPPSLQNRIPKKEKLLRPVRKLLSVARWLILPVVPVQRSSTSAQRPEISEKS